MHNIENLSFIVKIGGTLKTIIVAVVYKPLPTGTKTDHPNWSGNDPNQLSLRIN